MNPRDDKPRSPVATQSPNDSFDPRGSARNDAMLNRAEFREERGHEHSAPRQGMPPRPRDVDVDEFIERGDHPRSMAQHPLFRGLLQELPSRQSPPTKEWLDRWSSTARSILDLLYSRDQGD